MVFSNGKTLSEDLSWSNDHCGSITGLSSKAFTSACWDGTSSRIEGSTVLYYSGGSERIGNDAVSVSCNSVALSGEDIKGFEV